LIFRAAVAASNDHLATYAELDIALDPSPYNGTTTTCEALWMGVPVVTLCGDRHASRVGASLLTQVGLEELVCSDRDAYIETAAAMAHDIQGLAELRQSLRDRLAKSSLCDAAEFCQRMEKAFTQMRRNRET
jgi:predicted O-linked N-acetylglucosamine transferase (SPINDLY family)